MSAAARSRRKATSDPALRREYARARRVRHAFTLGIAGAADALDQGRLRAFAGELDAAGHGLLESARLSGDEAKRQLLPRASACFGAASLLRRIAR